MSDDDVLALRRVYDEWAKGNLWAGGELLADDILFEPFPERAVVHGLDGVRAYMREFLAQWSEFRAEAHEFIEAGNSVVARERQYAKGATSGIERVETFYAVWTFQNARATHVRWENDRDTALKAVALSE